MLKVGLTGGIACGKSMVAAMLAARGALLLDADQLSREVVAPGESAWQEIRDWLGDTYLLSDGKLDRRRIAALVFDSTSAREQLNAIVHPRVITLFQQCSVALKEKGEGLVQVWDVPLLLEVGMERYVDLILVVAAREGIQVERLGQRDGLTKAEAIQRIRSQMAVADKIRAADWVIYNNGTETELLSEVEHFWNGIRKL